MADLDLPRSLKSLQEFVALISQLLLLTGQQVVTVAVVASLVDERRNDVVLPRLVWAGLDVPHQVREGRDFRATAKPREVGQRVVHRLSFQALLGFWNARHGLIVW